MIYLTGDTHGSMNIQKLSAKRFEEGKTRTKDDYVVILGDFGIVWRSAKETDYWLKWLDEKPFTTLFVEGNHESVFYGTELLTENGFERIEDIFNKNIKVANYNIATKEIKFAYPVAKHKKYHEEAIHIKGFNTEQIVSLNHDIIIKNKKIKAKNLIGKRIKEKEFDLTGISINQGIGLEDNLIKLLIWIIMDATIIDYSKYNKNSKKCTIQFKLSKTRKIETVTKLLKDSNIPYTLKLVKKDGFNILQPYYIRIYGDYARRLKTLLNSKKQIPHNWRNANKEEAILILQALCKSDGSLRKDTQITWVSTNKNDVDIIQEICVKNGFYFKYKEREERSGFKKECKTQYLSSIYLKKTLNYEVAIEKLSYKDRMYCYTMPLGTLITRLNGKIAFTGNCYPTLNQYPRKIWKGGEIGVLSNSVFHLRRGQVYNINQKKIFTMGGAKSIDKEYRIENISWWEEELPSCNEENIGLENLEKNDFKVDYIFSHDCSESAFDILKKIEGYYDLGTYSLRKYFQFLEMNVQFKHWFFGHYHTDMQISEKHTVVYNEFIKLEEL